VVSVLETFDQDTPAQTVAHIARRSGLPVPTAHRIVTELVEMGLLERDADRRVHIGMRLWEIASVAPRAIRLREAAMPFMEDLHAATRQHTQLYVLEGREALLIERLSTHDAVAGNFAKVGGRVPLHATSGGLVLLAHADPGLQESFLSATLRAYTPHTPTDPAQVRRTLAAIRDRGHVVCDGYISTDVLAVAVPVRSPEGEVVAALAVLVPSSEPQPMVHVHALVVTSRGITRALAQPRPRMRPPPFFPLAEVLDPAAAVPIEHHHHEEKGAHDHHTSGRPRAARGGRGG
jgi:DNA-binding IclR family transcriptional regulator